MDLAQLDRRVKGLMASGRKEKGVKEVHASENLAQVDRDCQIEPFVQQQYGFNPDREHLQPFIRQPSFGRRIGFAFEAIVQRVSDRWITDCEQQNAQFLWATMAMTFGAAGYYFLPDEPSIYVLLALSLSLCLLVFRRATKGHSVFALVVVSMAFIGLTAASFHGTFSSTPVLKDNFSAQITGVIERVELRSGNGRPDERWTVRVETIDKLAAEETPRRLLLVRKSHGAQFVAGQRIRVRAHLIPLQRPAFPGGFDYGRYLWARAIGGQGYLSRSIETLPLAPVGLISGFSHDLQVRVERARTRIAGYIAKRVDGEAGGLAIALSVGKRNYLSSQAEDALRQSGLAHILAISGLHMALVALSVFWGTRTALALIPHLALHYPIKKWAAAIALVCAGGYLILSGSSVATIRAFFMTAIFLVAIFVGRPALTMHNLALALLFLVLFQPYGVVEAGMQMSFAATAALIASYDRLQRMRIRGYQPEKQSRGAGVATLTGRALGGVGRWFMGIGTTSLIAGLAVLPFSIAHFQQMAPLGLIANLLVMPIVSLVVMPLGLLSVLLAPLGLQSVPLSGVEWGLDWVITLAGLISARSGADYLVIRGAGHFIPLVILALAIFAIHRGKLAYAALVPLCAAFLMWWTAPSADLWISEKGNRVAYRDVNHAWQTLGSNRKTLEVTALLRSDGDARALRSGAISKSSEVLESTNGNAVLKGCDKEACYAQGLMNMRGEKSDLSVAIVRHASAFQEECDKRSILVTSLPVPNNCTAPLLVVGPDRLKQEGARFVDFKRHQEANLDRGDGQRNPLANASQAVWTLHQTTALPTGQRPWHPVIN
ncbi:hypothetical protein C0081_09325 [Cohaesibacter celericrescens]|uniref:Competence protein ComEC n=2 Tax=Cohaesibacter celericrescens TaxID=2067669 RepID=A0A2N5XSK7_9HYPH|nr:hypothetical protein C0081_09325 [Cohaesibacter celericrescens]